MTSVPSRPSPDGTPVVVAKAGRGTATQDLRRALESVLRHRRPLVCILDEGQHLMKIASGRKLRDQLEVIKSVANLSGVPHLLTGPYDLIPFLDLSGQLSRRSTIIHMPRYHNTRLEDAKLFSKVVSAFQRHLPLAEEPDLVGRVEYLYQHSIGCVGVLKDWLKKALGLALAEDSPTLTMSHLKKCALRAKQCHRLLTDAREGEKEMVDDEAEIASLQEELGMFSAEKFTAPSDVENGTKTTGKQKPFQRKPARDPVGHDDDHTP